MNEEINVPDDILAIIGDLTNGALNYYKTPRAIESKYRLLLNYITDLQNENQRLQKELQNSAKIIDELKKNGYKMTQIKCQK